MQRNNGGGNATGACASCRHQRKKCTEKCTLAPFFPVDKNREFQAVHKVFGVSNVTKILKRLNFEDRKRAADSLVWEAFSRQKDPILGPFGEYRRVLEELNWYKNEYQAYKSSLAASGGLINGLNETVMSNPGGMINYDANKYHIMNSKRNVVSGLYPSYNYYSCVPNNKLSEKSDNSCVIMPHQSAINGSSINQQHSYQLPGIYNVHACCLKHIIHMWHIINLVLHCFTGGVEQNRIEIEKS